MRLHKTGILLLVLMTTLQVFSQKSKSTISGIVLINNNKPGEAVSVALKGTAYATLTNSKGEYKISAEPGDYVIVITYVGYKTKNISIALKQGGKLVSDISMEEDMAALNEVAVRGKSKVQRAREQAYNITSVDLKKIYNTSSDLNQVLNKTTGVRIREFGGLGSAFNFSLNGFSGNQVKFFLDGVPMDSYGGALTLNNIPVTMAERIDVYKGVVPVELGTDALGGAINVITNKNVNRYIDASYSYGSFNTHRAAINTRFSGRDGFIANINAFANYSDNDYKVDVSVVDKNTSKFLPEQKFKHFHDAYKSGTIMAEAGFKNKKYADYLLVGFAMAGNNKEIQQGRSMLKVVGEAFTDSQSFISSLKYKKDNLFTKGLSLNFNTTYALVNNRLVDTSSRVYDWAGNYIYRQFGGSNDKGELGDKKIYVYDEANLQAIANLKYQFNEQHSLVVNYSYAGYKRKESDEYLKVKNLGEPKIDKNIVGLGYNFSGLDNRLAISAFGKMFGFSTQMSTKSDGNISASSTNYGYGSTATYHITDQFQVKASYEHSYRLPTPLEMLGDGANITPSVNLKPENSDNVNFGLGFITHKNKHHFGAESSVIYRNARDFIREKVEGDKAHSENLQNVQITGIDGVLRYGYSDFLSFEANATYQKKLNKNKFINGTSIPDALYDAQVPNEPILFGNADLGFNFKNIKYKHDRLSVNVSANYIDDFYLAWPVLGELETKKAIPEQFTQSAMISYSLLDGKYNLAFECNNITDVKVYDYYNIQKPGRSFTVKFRYFLQ
jgi:outer membrane receptor protein involved in Fe transport